MEIDKILFGKLSETKESEYSFEDLDINDDNVINEKDISDLTDQRKVSFINNLINEIDDDSELDINSSQTTKKASSIQSGGRKTTDSIETKEAIVVSTDSEQQTQSAIMYNIKDFTFEVTSKSGSESDFSYRITGNTIIITANDCTIDISGISTKSNNISLQTKGNNITLNCNTQLKSITNYAKNSEINGSDYEDNIINRAENVFIDAKGGNDTIKTYNKNTTVNVTDESIDKITSSKSLKTTINTSGLYCLNNKYYIDGVVANGEVQGMYFKNGTGYTGTIKSDDTTTKKYKQGTLISTEITTVEDGKTKTKTYDADNNLTQLKIKSNGRTYTINISGGEFTENNDGTFTVDKSVTNKKGITTNTTTNYDENGKLIKTNVETYDADYNLTKVRITQNGKSKTISAGSGELIKNDDGTFCLTKSVTNKKGITTNTITNYDERGKLTRTNVETYDADYNLTKVRITQNGKSKTISADEGILKQAGDFYIFTTNDNTKYYDNSGNEINKNDIITKAVALCNDINSDKITNINMSFDEAFNSINISFETDNTKWEISYTGTSNDFSILKYESDTKYNLYEYSNDGKLKQLQEFDDETHLNICTIYDYDNNTKDVSSMYYGYITKETTTYDLTTGKEISKVETNKEYFDYAMKLAEVNSDLLDYIVYQEWKSNNYGENITLSDSVKSDIDMLVAAHENALKTGTKGSEAYQKAFDEYISNSMVKDYTTQNKTDTEILSEISTGDVIEKSDGLYVNDNGTLTKLNMTKEQYIELFPPVKRYAVQQGGTGDCYFLSSVLTGAMNNPVTYAKLLQMINVDSKTNDVTVTFNGTSNYPVTFKNGELLETDQIYQEEERWGENASQGGASGAKGVLLLEQAFALARFASDENKDISSIDIDDALSYIYGGFNSEALNFVFGDIATADFEAGTSYETMQNALNSYANDVNNGNIILGASTKGEVGIDEQMDYSIIGSHAYTIQSIDTENQIVNIINPWAGGIVVSMSYETFINNYEALYIADLSKLTTNK